MNGTQKFQIHRDDRETTRLPCAHTCFNQLDLPAYENYDFLRNQMLLAINEGSEGFGLAWRKSMGVKIVQKIINNFVSQKNSTKF